MPTDHEEVSVAFPVRFYVKPGKVAELQRRAGELDDVARGAHQKMYTAEQAVAVVFHQDPDFLFSRLAGWVEESDDHAIWTGSEEWEDAEDAD